MQQIGRLTGLQELHLLGCELPTDGLRHLGGLRDLRELKCTADRQTTLGPGLGTLPRFARLKRLQIDNATDADLEQIAQLPDLRELQLYGPRVTDAGVQVLAGLTSLTSLVLFAESCTDVALEHLHGLGSLRSIRLHISSKASANAEARLREALPTARVYVTRARDVRSAPVADPPAGR
jgi:hypothetical protein